MNIWNALAFVGGFIFGILATILYAAITWNKRGLAADMNPYSMGVWWELRMYLATVLLDCVVKIMPEPEKRRFAHHLVPYLEGEIRQ